MPSDITKRILMESSNDIKKESDRITKILSVKNVVITSAVICAIGGIIGMFFISPLKWWGGTIFGFLINLLCFRLMYLNLEKSLSKSKQSSKAVSFGGYSVRYIIKAFALYASFKNEYLSVGSCVIGLLSISAAIHVLNILNIQFAKSKEGSD